MQCVSVEDESEDDAVSDRDTPSKRSSHVATPCEETISAKIADTSVSSSSMTERPMSSPPVIPSLYPYEIMNQLKTVIDVDDYETIRNPFSQASSSLTSSYIYDIIDDNL